MREKLIELSRQLRYCAVDDDCINCKRWDFDCGSRHCVDDLMLKASELLESIANGVTIQKWIPVTERLPDKNGEYLCRHTDKSVHSAEYECAYGSFGYWFDFWEDEYKEWIAYDGVTHWMPLPEPPKGE